MSRDQQCLIDYLAHMLEAIERINRYTEDIDELAFCIRNWYKTPSSETWKFWAKPEQHSKHYPDFAAQHSELPLPFAYQMRNAVARG